MIPSVSARTFYLGLLRAGRQLHRMSNDSMGVAA